MPSSGWLRKKIYLPLGSSRWALRYFILLDSELRLYKDEYTSSPSHILDLKLVDQIIPIPTTHRPFCIRIDRFNNKKSWILDCNSQIDMETWFLALKKRLYKISKYPYPQSIMPLQIYREPTLPLRCVNLDQETDDNKKSSLLSRRNKDLAPIKTNLYQKSNTPSASSSTTLSSVHSSSSASLDLPDHCYKQENVSVENYSPTYLMYKKRFHI